MKATHYKTSDTGTACGIVGGVFMSSAASAVDCVRCRRTAVFQFARTGAGYSLAQIAHELDETAAGRSYHGNALRVAKDLRGITPIERSVLDAWATGATASNPARNWSAELQAIAQKVRAQFAGVQAPGQRGEG